MEEVAPFVDGALKEQVRGSVHIGIDDASGYKQKLKHFLCKTDRELKVTKIHKKLVCLYDCMVNPLFASQGCRNRLRLKHSSHQT